MQAQAEHEHQLQAEYEAEMQAQAEAETLKYTIMTDNTIIPAQYLEQISPIEQTAKNYLASTKGIEINDDLSLGIAAKLKKDITSFLSGTNKQRLAITQPARDLVSAINERAEQAVEPANEAKTIVTKAIVEYEEKIAEQKRIESARIAKINQVFLVAETKDTIELNVEMRTKVEAYFKSLPTTDQNIPEIKQASFSLVERINQKIILLQEQEAQAESQRKLDEAKKAQDVQAIEQAQKQAELDKQAREQLAEDRRLKDEQIKQKLEAEKLKANATFKIATGIRTYTKFTIEDATLVPREYCEPSDKLINSAIKAGITEIAGIKIYQEKK